MKDEDIREKLGVLNRDNLIQNFISQANARYILFNTSEARNNFPPYTIIDYNLNLLALYYLNFGCSFAENNNFEEAINPLEKGASLLEFIHGADAGKHANSNYYGLIAELAYYVSFQYSKAFILIKKIKSTSLIATLCHLFLSRNFVKLSEELDKVLTSEEYQDDVISRTENLRESSTLVYTVVVSRALDGFLKYLYTGNKEVLETSKQLLSNLKEITEIEQDPGIWWVVRLLLLISHGFDEASLWNTLNLHFDIEDSRVKGYIYSLVYLPPRGIFELFITQRKALTKVLKDNDGCIVSIPTSSGKTRIAEIAILNCTLNNSLNKVLYVAPFRSLAFEIENSLEPILGNANISVSHLYGGSLYSKMDEEIIDDSDVIIATPEKAKAIIRGNAELIKQIKLIIIDEGHLLGPSKRLITNEIFYEELRYYMEQNEGKFLLLSAVLPNSDELAGWLTKSDQSVFKSDWRPSDERLGILQYNSDVVNLRWMSQDNERNSFNNKFIIAEALPLTGRQWKIKYFPGSLNEAVAATAYKLHTFGPVLIFVGRKDSVFVMATSYLKCLGNEPKNHRWKNTSDWKAFELACTETYGLHNNLWYSFAQKGILCHNANLHADVRLPLERLMRSDKPLVIISTSTLGQGVNLGISTVIFSTLYQSGELITPRDFWNIAGRAGRAYVDHEGKILVAWNSSNIAPNNYQWHINNIKRYFNKDKIDIAKSGILSRIIDLKNIAEENDVEFELLTQLIAENNTKDIGEGASEIDEVLDWVDDTLLSLILLNADSDDDNDLSWSDEFFKKSLAYIQAQKETVISGDEVIAILKARLEGVIQKVGTSRNKWRSIVKSGIPLSTDLIIEERLAQIIATTQKFEIGNDIIDLLIAIEDLIQDLPVFSEDGDDFSSDHIESIRRNWLTGVAISEFGSLENAIEIITKYYNFKLPWILNGIAKKMRNIEFEKEAELIERLSLCVECGLPSIVPIKIYQAGIRSRSSAKEISLLFETDEDRPIISYKRELIREVESYKLMVTENTAHWLDLLSNAASRKKIRVSNIPNFTLGEVHEQTKILLAKKINGKIFLTSPDFKFMQEINDGNIDFSEIANIPGIRFKYSRLRKFWRIEILNPYVEVN